jgi:hypothetical protein
MWPFHDDVMTVSGVAGIMTSEPEALSELASE